MIDPADHHTATLPAIEPVAAKPLRMTSRLRRAAMAFRGPKERPGCQTCKGCEVRMNRPDTFDERGQLWCTVGNFPVMKGSICAAWKGRT